MAVHFLHAPAKRLEPVAVHVDVMAECGGLALAEAVGVHDGDQIIQLVHPGQRSGFPDSAFGDFTVAHEHVGVVIQLVLAGGQRHARAHPETLTKRAGGHVGKGQTRRGMAFEVVAKLAQL